MIGTVTLNPSIDQHWIVKDFVKDDTNRAWKILETSGGKGINVSKAVRELGGKTGAYVFLGGLAGNHFLDLAKPLDFPIHKIAISGTTRVNIFITDQKDKTQTRMSAPGPTIRMVEAERMWRLLGRVSKRHRYWVFSGSLPSGLPSTTYKRFIGMLQREGRLCALDADDDALRHGVEAKPFLIKPNEFEMRRLAGEDLRSISDYLREAKKLVRFGIRIVVVSLGPKGALFVSGRESVYVKPPAVTVRSHLGAGDTLIGGFLTGLSLGRSLGESARLAVAASVSCVMREAPRLCLREDIPRLEKRLAVRPV